MKIKVLFLINNLHRGGAERNFLNQANSLDQEKFDIYFATILKEKKEQGFLPELKIAPEKIICFDFKNLSDFKAWFRFISFLKREKFDLVYSTLFFANFLNRAGSIFAKTKSIVRETNIAEVKPRKEILADKILSWFSYKIIAPSETVARSIVKTEKIPWSKIEIIHNGVKIPEKKQSVRSNFSINSADFVFLNVGMFKTEQKGQKYLIEAFKLLKKSNLKLLLVGEGEKIKELKPGSNVILAGLQKDLESIYQSADVFVLSSLWEGCPNVLLEAMANKLACIATRVGGVEEIISHLETGYLVGPKDILGLKQAMAFMLKNPEKRKEIGQKGWERVLADFSLKKNIAKLETLFIICAES